MGRSVGNVGGAADRHFAPQCRDDLSAEDLELLEHRWQRQAGMVDKEQLALVVTWSRIEA